MSKKGSVRPSDCPQCDKPLPNRRRGYHDECVALAKEAARTGPRRCSRCKGTKEASEFSNDRNRLDGKYPWCMSCQGAHRAETRFQVRDGPLNGYFCPLDDTPIRGHLNRRYCSAKCKDRAKSLGAKFGLSVTEYRELVAATDGLCPVCGLIPERWHVDHDHTTGLTMGVVCASCNVSLLAASRHDVALVRSLLSYLERSPASRLGIRAYAPMAPTPPNIHKMWVHNA